MHGTRRSSAATTWGNKRWERKECVDRPWTPDGGGPRAGIR
jgi:hypothetical protein